MRWLLILVFAACAAPTRPRFANAPTVAHVDDRQDVAKAPRERPYTRYLLHLDSYYQRSIRGMKLTRHRRALGVNSFDEVPDSTWFTNRTGRRALTVDEIRRGPGPESPENFLPWKIERMKSGGTAPGFVVRDSRGVKFLLKFDNSPDFPELETGADAIVTRLFYAAGYNTPSDHVVNFNRRDLQLASDAYTKVKGKKQPLEDRHVDATLASIPRSADGKIRAIASIYVDGKPLGGSPRLGVRADDPNDLIPHEMRRDVRGQAALIAWLDHGDVKEDNTLDSWQEDPANKKIHYVIHYLIDFGESLGAGAMTRPAVGTEFGIDFKEILTSILTLGVMPKPWESRSPRTKIRGIGLFDPADYDAATYKPTTPAHLPAIWADRFDNFWSSKLIIRFTREQIAAAVEAGRYTDPRAAPYLVDAIIARQRKTAQHWFRQVTPIDELAIVDNQLCFTDLSVRHQLETGVTKFTATASDAEGRSLPDRTTATADAAGRACLSLVLASGKDRYTIIRVDSSRGMPGTQVHVAIDPTTNKPWVIGIHRL
jgi:hypothetical protein